MKFQDDLVDHLSKFTAAPFLFVGSGMSRRYLGLPNWSELLEHFADLTGKPYARYFSDANGSLAEVAALISDDFRTIWWEDQKFTESRTATPHPKNRESPLKIEVARLVADSLENLPAGGNDAEELRLLSKAVIAGVITTNYDPLVTHLFPDFTAFVGQDAILFKDPLGVGEIYQIHGSHTDPDSLVLTTGDYERFHERNPYLAAKLLTIFVEHPVVFLGYSLNDPNVLEILGSIAAILTKENIHELRDRLLVIEWDSSIQEPAMSRSTVIAAGVNIPVVSITVPDFHDIFSSLNRLTRRFPARLLRQLKEQVYELVQTSEPKGKVYVSDLDADTEGQDFDVVIGVGINSRLSEVGVVGLTRANLFDDVLKNHSSFGSPHDIVNKALPALMQRRSANVPIYAYLRAAGHLNDDGSLVDEARVPLIVLERFNGGLKILEPSTTMLKAGRRVVDEAKDLKGLIDRGKIDDVLYYATLLSPDKVDLELLRDFLLEHRALLSTGHSLQATCWAKCLCFYDLLLNRTI